jgi:hypothetical protein
MALFSGPAFAAWLLFFRFLIVVKKEIPFRVIFETNYT